jgi:(heptosyl)LPS beta-1,4-glucosyltransferase
MNSKITAIIIAKDEADVLANCIKTIAWADQILVIDCNSTDKTGEVAENLGAKVIHFSHSSFARIRNEALGNVETDWLFYIDADERVTPILAKEILVHVETQDAPVMSMKRKNICYGSEFKHGGWEQDEVIRVFRKDALKKWTGKIHESPIYEGKKLLLHSPLIHLTHRDTIQGLKKTIDWTPIEAELLYKSNIPQVKFLTILRKGFMEFFRRGLVKKGYKDGMPGLVEALIQGINRMLVYIQVWEQQQSPSLPDQYRKQEIKIAKMWDQEDIKDFKP